MPYAGLLDVASVSSLSLRGTALPGVAAACIADALKANGSPMWTVVSDARLKDVVGDFPLGVHELMRLRPNGLLLRRLLGRHPLVVLRFRIDGWLAAKNLGHCSAQRD